MALPHAVEGLVLADASMDKDDIQRWAEVEASASQVRRLLHTETYSATELLAVSLVSEAVANMMESRSHQVIRPLLSLLASILLLRVAQDIAKRTEIDDFMVMEIGTANGYFGALAVLRGWSYIGIERHEARAAFQRLVLNELTGGAILEIDGERDQLGKGSPPLVGQMAWDSLLRSEPVIRADLVICNYDLAELSPFQTDRVLALAATSLRASDAGVLLLPRKDGSHKGSNDRLRQKLERHNFRNIARQLFMSYRPQEIPANGRLLGLGKWAPAIGGLGPLIRDQGDDLALSPQSVPNLPPLPPSPTPRGWPVSASDILRILDLT